MNPSATRSPATDWQVIDQHVADFEEALAANGVAALADYLPPAGDPLRTPILLELVRVDLEHAWKSGRARLLEDFRADFPELFADREALAAIAFEEYRLRLQAG